MNTQLSFDLRTRRFPDLQERIEENFFFFHKENPTVFKLFKRFAHDIKSRGLSHYGAKAIMERIRWHIEVDTIGGDFKINNNYTSCYARLLIEEDSSFKNFFEIRRTPGILEIHVPVSEG